MITIIYFSNKVMIAAYLYVNNKDIDFRLSYVMVPGRIGKPSERLKFPFKQVDKGQISTVKR